jgi:ribonuclease HI
MDLAEQLFIWSDGACVGNPGPGGWGALLRWKHHEKEIFGGENYTTNNRMEMMAVISALEAVTKPMNIVVVTDSQYVKNGITKWVTNWKRNGWRTGKNAVKNQDLWVRLDKLNSQYNVSWEWVKGHAGHPENERADRLAHKGVPKRVR